jgi:hypothetical protein
VSAGKVAGGGPAPVARSTGRAVGWWPPPAGDGGCDWETYTQTCHDRRRTEEVGIGESLRGCQHRRGMHVGQVRRNWPLFLSPQRGRCACSGGLSRTVLSAPRLRRRRAACDPRLTSTESGSQGSPGAPCGRTDGQRFMANVVSVPLVKSHLRRARRWARRARVRIALVRDSSSRWLRIASGCAAAQRSGSISSRHGSSACKRSRRSRT